MQLSGLTYIGLLAVSGLSPTGVGESVEVGLGVAGGVTVAVSVIVVVSVIAEVGVGVLVA